LFIFLKSAKKQSQEVPCIPRRSPPLPGLVVQAPGNFLPLDYQSPASDDEKNTAREPIPGQYPADRASSGQQLTGAA